MVSVFFRLAKLKKKNRTPCRYVCYHGTWVSTVSDGTVQQRTSSANYCRFIWKFDLAATPLNLFTCFLLSDVSTLLPVAAGSATGQSCQSTFGYTPPWSRSADSCCLLRCTTSIALHVWTFPEGSINPLKTESESESELLYDWRFTANRFVLATTPWDSRPVILFSIWTFAVIVLM
jgi:hypothetical protein